MSIQPNIILLREGTDTSQGRAQTISNINACQAVVDIVRTTLGPRGMDKLVYDDKKVTISNDGATIMKMLDIVHPAAKTLVDIAKSQDAEVGDGTTSVVVLAGEFLKECKPLLEEGVHAQTIIRGFTNACQLARKKVQELQINVDQANPAEVRKLLEKCAATSLNSKLVSSHKEYFAKMVVDAVLHLDEDLDIDMIGIKKESGGALDDSIFVEGVAFKKCFSYAGFEQQPKKFLNPKIVLLNIELELKAERSNAEIHIDDPTQYQAMIDAEWDIIYGKLEAIVKTGAQVVLSRLAIGDLGTQYFADRGIFCAGRVTEDDLRRVAKATGGAIQTSVGDLHAGILGTCEVFEERQVGGERYNFFTGCKQAKSCTIILRGGGEQFVDEAERSIHDAIMVVRRARKHTSVVAGGGAVEMELSRYLRDYSRTIAGKEQLIINVYARALEVIPRQVSDNAGFDSVDILNKLRRRHAQEGGQHFGVDIVNAGICNTMESAVWEPTLVKLNSITAATEATCLILSVDETIKNPKAESQDDNRPAPPPRGRGRGAGRRR